MRLIVNALIVIGMALFAWLVAFLSLCVLYAGPHGPRHKTLALVAMVPAILAMSVVAILVFRQYSRRISET
jgi:uncharacterized membrane protein